jgi:hypothetical protein
MSCGYCKNICDIGWKRLASSPAEKCFHGLWMKNIITSQYIFAIRTQSRVFVFCGYSFFDGLGVYNWVWGGEGTWSYNMILWIVWPVWFRSRNAELFSAVETKALLLLMPSSLDCVLQPDLMNSCMASVGHVQQLTKFVLTCCRLQGDLLGGEAELIIINHAIIYGWKQKLASIYLGIFGDTELQEMLKLASLRLRTQADTTLHVHESCSQHGKREYNNCKNGANQTRRQTGTRSVLQSTQCYQVSFSSVNYWVVYNYYFGAFFEWIAL